MYVYFPRRIFRRLTVELPVTINGAADTSRLFVEALSASRIEDAQACISKDSARYFDLIELSEYFSQNYNYKRLQKAELSPKPSHCVTDSLLVQENGCNSIIHLHMIKELGIWKIYDIDKE